MDNKIIKRVISIEGLVFLLMLLGVALRLYGVHSHVESMRFGAAHPDLLKQLPESEIVGLYYKPLTCIFAGNFLVFVCLCYFIIRLINKLKKK